MSQYTYSNILVPIDLSESSLNALDTATALAVKKKAKLFILYIEDEEMDSILNEKHGLFNQLDHSDVISALANSIYNKTGLKPQVIKNDGAVTPCIIKTCIENNCDLIVMGSHGASGYRDGFIGTNAYNVIKYANCPVLTVPAGKKWTQFRKVVFPIRPVTGALMRYDIVKNFLSSDSQLNILGLSYRRQERVQNVLDEITLEISKKIREDKVIAKTSWGNGNGIAEDVLSYSGEHNPDLIVVTSSLDVTNKPHFVGPNAQKIISNAKMPVLSIRKFSLPVAVNG
jgi:nucleotide-binding universal stress UspA family protein